MRLSKISLLFFLSSPLVGAAQDSEDSSGTEDSAAEDSEPSNEAETTNEEAEASGEEDSPAPADTDLLQSEAIRAPELTENQIRWLKPKRELMYAVPRAQVDFTAYTLEWGEVKVGLANVVVGVAPRVQLGTSPMLNLLGVYNVSGKANPVRIGRFDLAVDGNYYTLPLGDFALTYTGGGLRMSAQLMEPWSVHLGGTVNRLNGGGGTPDLSGVAPMLLGTTAEALEEYEEVLAQEDVNVELNASVYTVNFATDWRFNRRDSLIFQAGAWLNVNADAALYVPPIAGLEEAFDESREYEFGDAYMASLAYHIAGKRWEFRFGIGVSSADWAWLLQSTDLSYRFGGETRMGEGRARRTWRRNAGDVQR